MIIAQESNAGEKYNFSQDLHFVYLLQSRARIR